MCLQVNIRYRYIAILYCTQERVVRAIPLLWRICSPDLIWYSVILFNRFLLVIFLRFCCYRKIYKNNFTFYEKIFLDNLLQALVRACNRLLLRRTSFGRRNPRFSKSCVGFLSLLTWVWPWDWNPFGPRWRIEETYRLIEKYLSFETSWSRRIQRFYGNQSLNIWTGKSLSLIHI